MAMTINEKFASYSVAANVCYDPFFFAKERVLSLATRAKVEP